jgi:thiamine biosynthesis lipoprotein
MQIAAVTKPAATRASIAAAGPVGPAWDTSMELTINFELAELAGAVKRPFVAARVEDADRFQVKTLAVWFHEDRYLTDEGVVSF